MKQFAGRLVGDGRRNLEFHLAMTTIILCTHEVLGVQQAILDVSKESITILELLVDWRHLAKARLVGQERRRWPCIDHLKRSSLDRRLEDVL